MTERREGELRADLGRWRGETGGDRAVQPGVLRAGKGGRGRVADAGCAGSLGLALLTFDQNLRTGRGACEAVGSSGALSAACVCWCRSPEDTRLSRREPSPRGSAGQAETHPPS